MNYFWNNLSQQLSQCKKLDLFCEKLELNASRLVCILLSNVLPTKLNDLVDHKIFVPDFSLVYCLQ